MSAVSQAGEGAPRARPCGVVTLLTDFGVSAPFVGVMKGVLLREAPALQVVDLSHGVPAFAIDQAGFWIQRCFGWFPPGSVHVCVVDPGVGTEREALAVEAAGHYFLAPDNGLLTGVLQQDALARVQRIELARLGLATPSRTFHGRDVFAPVAARLASAAVRLEDLGPSHRPLLSELRAPHASATEASGRVRVIDGFGNLISDLPAEWLGRAGASVEIAGHTVRIVGTYGEAADGECVALVSSFGTLEIAQRNGSAANALGLARGAEVRLRFRA